MTRQFYINRHARFVQPSHGFLGGVCSSWRSPARGRQALLAALFGFLCALRVSEDAMNIVILRAAPLLPAARRISPAFS